MQKKLSRVVFNSDTLSSEFKNFALKTEFVANMCIVHAKKKNEKKQKNFKINSPFAFFAKLFFPCRD